MEMTTFGPVTIVSVGGKLNGATFPQLVEEAQAIVDKGHANLVIDLTGVGEVSSGALVALQSIAGYAVRHGGNVALGGIRPSVAQVMRVMGFDRLVSCFSDVAAAQASFSVQPAEPEHAIRNPAVSRPVRVRS